MKIKPIILATLTLLTLGGMGNTLNNRENTYSTPMNVKAMHYYPKTRYYQRTLYNEATRKIKYYHKWHHYWVKKYHHIDKLYTPVYWQNNPYERRLSHLDSYYYGKVIKCDNNEGTWSDIKYAIYKYPLNHKSARHIIWRLYKYNIRKHNDELDEYLSFCHYYKIKPKYRTRQWHKQLIYFVYEE